MAERSVTMRRKSLVVSVLAIGVTLGTGYAIAQRGPGWDMPGMPMGRGMMGMMNMMAGCPMMGMGGQTQTSAFIDGRVAFLKAELAITDAQKAVWDAYAEAIKRNLQSMQAMAQTMQAILEAKTPVERLDAHLVAMEGRVNALKEVKPALAKLYEALSVEQKKKADEILTGMGCMM
jgi:LTXXQ motif family protein